MGKLRTHIKVHRARMNMTQKDLADAVDVRRETITLNKGAICLPWSSLTGSPAYLASPLRNCSSLKTLR